MEKKTITLDYQEYLKLEDKIKLLESATSKLTVECCTLRPTGNGDISYRFGLDLSTGLQKELVDLLKVIEKSNKETLDRILKEKTPERNQRLTAAELGIKPLSPSKFFLQRLIYLFTGKLN